MKKIILFALLSVGIIKAEAQQTEVGLDLPVVKPRISVEQESRQLQLTLLLNEDQYLKAKEINKERRENLDAVSAMYPHEPEKRDEKIQEVEEQYDAEFAAIFTKKQLAEYLELHGRSETAEIKPKAPEGPSFNAQIQAVIQKALTPAVDSTQLASQDCLGTPCPDADSLAIFPAGLPNDSTKMNIFNIPLQDEIAKKQTPEPVKLVTDEPGKTATELNNLPATDTFQISLLHNATVQDNKPKPIEKEIITLTDEGVTWEQGDQQSDVKIKNDAKNGRLKVETPEGELKMDGSNEKSKSTDGIKYKNTENDKMKVETPERETKFKDGRESMKPKK